MMKPALIVAALIFAQLISPPAAQAANRGQQLNPRLVHGRVVGVRMGNGGGILQIRTGQRINNPGAANPQAIVPVMHQFAIGPATHFEVASGLNRMPASAAMLRPGQRIIVQAQGQQATGVQILARSPNAGARRGLYHAVRVPTAVRGNRAVPSPPAGHVPKAAGANLHHVSTIGGAPRVAAKGR